ncbi:MAG: TolC family protein, partial [Betaproteobacteria bacterium]|nr:TolC family protein [Betaproteobacteria bacterium]
MNSRSHVRTQLTTLILAMTLAGCASFANIEPAAKTVVPATLGTADSPIKWPATGWWRQFDDPKLDALIERALAGNPNLQLAAAREAKARAVAGSTESALWPQINASADSTRQRLSEFGTTPPPFAGTTQNINHAGLNAGWELDFFGRNRAALDAALGQARAAEADAQAARILLASNVARSYFGLARLLEQREVARATLVQREAILQLVNSRVEAGIDTKVELRQAEGSLPEIRRDIESLNEQIGLARHALAALSGQG